MKPVLIVVAGANGSGKTSLTSKIVSHGWSEGCAYINPDNIARDQFGDWNNPENSLKASVVAENMRVRLLSERKSMTFETVLSMPDKLAFMRDAKDAGYFVRFFYIGTLSPAINAARVAQRMMEGGHAVPIEKIISRYPRSIANCVVGCKIADRGYVYDNSGLPEDERLLFRTKDGLLVRQYDLDLHAYPWAEKVLAAINDELDRQKPVFR